MLILRIFLILVALFLVLNGGMYLYTRNPRYLRIANQAIRLTTYLVLLFALLYVLERYALVGWRVLL